jgi:CrcB protein
MKKLILFIKLTTSQIKLIMKTILMVGFGGFLGSLARYGSTLWITRIFPSILPLGTFFVNLTGCLLIGIVIQATENNGQSSAWRLLLATGFCGGFTTFSAFAQENLRLIQEGHYLHFIFYTLLSVSGGILAALAGCLIAKSFQ